MLNLLKIIKIYNMTELIKNLNWRYATKEFDVTKVISKEDLDEIIETFRLTPSSFGLEPWKLIIVENPELREKLLWHSWNQKQIVDASHLLVFARVNKIDDIFVDKFMNNNSKITWATREQLQWYEDMIKWFIWNLNEEQFKLWAHEQVYLALWNVTNALAQKHIDSCIIWGFDPYKYDEVLWLDKDWLSSVVVMPIWYRLESDKYASKAKVRFPREEIVIKK